jgi:hypothetical protein
MAASDLAIKIVDALNGNEYWSSHVDIPRTEDIHVGPLTFRYGGGPKRDRWYWVEPPHPCKDAAGLVQHDFQPDPDNAAWAVCSRTVCGYRVLISNLH